MTDRRAYAVARVVIAMLMLFSLVAYLGSALAARATDEATLLEKMQQYADTDARGVTVKEYPQLARAITGYLRGETATPQVLLDRGQLREEAFSPNEVEHLRDVRGLVRLSYGLRVGAIAVVAALLVMSFLLERLHPGWIRRVEPLRAIRWGSWVFLGMAAALALWGALHFESLFIAFHRVLFRNDLWLLNPQQDLLLQLMPLPLFISYGVDLLKANVFLLLMLVVIAFGLRTKRVQA